MKRLTLCLFLICFVMVGCMIENPFEKKPTPPPLPPVAKIQEEPKPSEPKLVYYRKVIIEEVRPIETQEEKDAYVTLLKEKR